MILMTTFQQSFDVRVRRQLPDKAIFWPTAIGYGDQPQNGDSTKFPGLTAIKARRKAVPVAPLAEFVNAARNAQDRILILDEYLFKPPEGTFQIRVEEVLSWFPVSLEAGDVRLLTASTGNSDLDNDLSKRFTERATQINRAGLFDTRRHVIQVRFTLKTNFPYVHDRFAIIDDELWHFGATVGGLHEHVNAVTRGWAADDHNAPDFFETAWTGDPDMGHSFSKPTRQR